VRLIDPALLTESVMGALEPPLIPEYSDATPLKKAVTQHEKKRTDIPKSLPYQVKTGRPGVVQSTLIDIKNEDNSDF
jgi:hypothetical protein